MSVRAIAGDSVAARARCGGKNLSELMAENGLAWPVDGPGSREDIRRSEAVMRDLGIGLWSQDEPEKLWLINRDASPAR